MALFPVLILPIFFSTARGDDGSSWSAGQICGLVLGVIFAIFVVVVVCLACFRYLVRFNHGKMFSPVHETTSPVLVVAQPPPQSSPPQVHSSRYLPSFGTAGPLYTVQGAPYSQVESKNSCYPSLSGYIQENPMTISQSYSCQAERLNPVMASAPIASLESIPHEDLSDSSVYRRFFSPEVDILPVKSSECPLSPASAINPPHPPTDFPSKARRFSLALRDAARMFMFNSGNATGGSGGRAQQEDTITLEDGTTTSSSLPQSSANGGSQARLFKQQKATKKISSGSGSKIGRKGKISSASQDIGHCNSFEVAELDEMESSIDNDRFLHSLESAVFTPSADTLGLATNSVSPLYSSSSTLNSGDLGDFGSHSRGGSLYPPLPPGSPVIGFAYLGLGGLQEEEEMDLESEQRIEETESREVSSNDPRGSASTVRTDLVQAGAPSLDDEVKLRNRCQIIDQRDRNQSLHNSSDSATSATAMLSRETRHSISASETDVRPPSANIEPWMVVSDEHLLIGPIGETYSSSRAKGGHLWRSLSSNNLMKK
ncbi:hypothetical protein Aperf_G00000109342 [Anoplocephala perfoliata]